MSAGRAGTGLLALALSLGLEVAEACEVRLSRGWTSMRGGYGTLIVPRNGGPCGDIVYAVPAERVPASALRLAAAPAHGEVTIAGATFAYRPRPGFTGEDRFALVGTGLGPKGRLLRLRGLITVIVH